MNESPKQAPPPGITFDATIEQWHDADTCYVTVTRRVRLRLLDNWQEELHRGTEAEKAEAREATAFASDQFPPGSRLRVFVPRGPSELELADSTSLGRALAQAWPLDADGQVATRSVSAEITDHYGRTTPKPPPKKKKPRRPKGGAAAP